MRLSRSDSKRVDSWEPTSRVFSVSGFRRRCAAYQRGRTKTSNTGNIAGHAFKNLFQTGLIVSERRSATVLLVQSERNITVSALRMLLVFIGLHLTAFWSVNADFHDRSSGNTSAKQNTPTSRGCNYAHANLNQTINSAFRHLKKSANLNKTSSRTHVS